MPGADGHPTLKDVAERAGVSVGSASNAFNHPERVSAELRDRVEAAAVALGYAGPDPAGRRLRTGRAGALGLIFTESLRYAFTDPAAPLFLRGVAEGMSGGETGLLLIPTSPSRELATRAVRQAAVDGFIVYSVPGNDPRLEAALARQLPIVTVDQPRGAATPFVGVDDRAAAAAAARHVRELGHRRVAVLSFLLRADNDPERPFDLTADRLAGYREGLGDAWDERRVRYCLPNSPERARAVARELLDAPDPPTALLAMSDVLALGALDGAHDAGVRVPADLSIVGFDDSPPARRSSPPLTTVAQPHEWKGRLAARLLLAEIESGPRTGPPPRELLETRLVVRESTGPAPAQSTPSSSSR